MLDTLAKNRPPALMSIDLEEWFTVLNFQNAIARSNWDNYEPRAEKSTLQILEIFRRHNIKATFFVLGWLSDRNPDLIQEIAHQGHEIACHGYSHKPLTQLNPDALRKELEACLTSLSKANVPRPIGFRAPSFSLTQTTSWAFGILEEFEFRYDSSIFPISFHPEYGISDAPLDPYRVTETIWEVPMTVAKIGSRNIPCSGGGYFRIFPYFIFKYLMKLAVNQGRTPNFYLHPWELDPDQPRMSTGSLTKNIRHYVGLHRTIDRLEMLCNSYQFTPISEALL